MFGRLPEGSPVETWTSLVPSLAQFSWTGVSDSGNETWALIVDSFWPLLWAGLRGTIPLALASFAIGLLIALGIALLRLSANRVLSGIARFYVSVIRGTPLLVQLFVIFYGLPSIGVVIDPWPAAIIAFSLNVGGYAAEIIRAAILSVPKGQWEAGHTVGLSHAKTLRRIILPQAARVSVPPLSNTFISLVKDTSLASLILVTELFRQAQLIAAFTYEFMVIYLEAAVIYWLFCLVLSTGQSAIERRLDRYVAH
jgi:cystine transport system permease protein